MIGPTCDGCGRWPMAHSPLCYDCQGDLLDSIREVLNTHVFNLPRCAECGEPDPNEQGMCGPCEALMMERAHG